jgi:beta-lactamase class A
MPLKSIFRTALLVSFLSLSTSCLAQVPSASPVPLATDVPLQRLQGEFARAEKSAGGTLGVSAVHLETGRRIAFNGRERFPMASTYKIAIAVQLLHQVDQGAVSLDRMVELKTSDFHPGSGMLTELLSRSGVSLSVRNLLELMLVLSDNTATDLLLRLAGGPEAVTARVRAMGIRDMDIHRPTVNMIADSEGYALPPENEWKPALFQKLYEATPEESRKASLRNFQTDPRDTSSPEAMGMLLERMVRGEGLKGESRALLLDIMERCQTGKARIKGILPPGTVVVHKTGTFSGITNDAGIITLPQDAGHVAIAVFVKSSLRTPAERERAIAQVSRAVYDFFLFQPADRGMMK